MGADMPVISAKFHVGDVECVVGVQYNHREISRNKKGSVADCGRVLPGFWRDETPTVRDFALSSRERLASAVASAAIVRDVAALGALVLFGTMLVLVLSSADMLV